MGNSPLNPFANALKPNLGSGQEAQNGQQGYQPGSVALNRKGFGLKEAAASSVLQPGQLTEGVEPAGKVDSRARFSLLLLKEEPVEDGTGSATNSPSQGGNDDPNAFTPAANNANAEKVYSIPMNDGSSHRPVTDPFANVLPPQPAKKFHVSKKMPVSPIPNTLDQSGFPVIGDLRV